MTLKKYNVILYFIILLNLLMVNVIIAQDNTLLPSSTVSSSPASSIGASSSSPTAKSSLSPNSTTSGEIPSSTPSDNKYTSLESCDPGCKIANETLALCGGTITSPSYYIEKGNNSGTYKPESDDLSKCMCNLPYFNLFTECIECYSKVTKTDFRVLPLEEYKAECKKLGSAFTQNFRPPKNGMSLAFKLMIALTVVVTGLLAMAILHFLRSKRRRKQQEAFAQKYTSNFSGLSKSDGEKYPPPQSHTTHYPPPPTTSTSQYVPPTEYPPPNYPAPSSSSPYPPPGGEYPPPQSHSSSHEGGGQADSYFDGKF